ncbi:hypothetical protein OROHE_020449 [Orobanche hederae]
MADELVVFSSADFPPPDCCADVSQAFTNGSAICVYYSILEAVFSDFRSSPASYSLSLPSANFSLKTLCSEFTVDAASKQSQNLRSDAEPGVASKFGSGNREESYCSWFVVLSFTGWTRSRMDQASPSKASSNGQRVDLMEASFSPSRGANFCVHSGFGWH